jgi:hypothetical protein
MIGKLRSRWQWPVCLLLMVLGLGSLVVDHFGGSVWGQPPNPQVSGCTQNLSGWCLNCEQAYLNEINQTTGDPYLVIMQNARAHYNYCISQCGGCPPPCALCNGAPYTWPTQACCGGAIYYNPPSNFDCCGGYPFVAGQGLACCHGVTYDTNLYTCTDGQITPLYIYEYAPCQ